MESTAITAKTLGDIQARIIVENKKAITSLDIVKI
jgi:hypothetical protein